VIGAQALACLGIEVLVEQQQLAPVFAEVYIIAAMTRPAATIIRREQPGQPPAQLLSDLVEREMPAGAAGILHRELIAIKPVVSFERFDQQIVDGEPDRAAPV
jgi:hypothetical protein